MRYLVLLGLVGCATPYQGTTMAQQRWAESYWRCQGQETPECHYVRETFAREDAEERQALATPSRARNAFAGFAHAAATPPPIAQPQPIFQPDVRCKSTTYAGTTTTRCY